MTRRFLWLLAVGLCLVLCTSITNAQETMPCTGSLPPRLIVGEIGRVTPGDANNVRSDASSDAELTGQIPAGERFNVLEGPICNDGYTWWKINHKGLIGWTVEGSADSYWLEPVEPMASDEQPAEVYAVVSSETAETPQFDGNVEDLLGSGTVQRVEISPDGAWIAVVSSNGVWLYTAHAPDEFPSLLYANQDFINDVAFSGDSRILAIATGEFRQPEGQVWMWDLETFDLQTLIDAKGYVSGVDFSPNGEQLAISGEQLALWNVANQQQERLISPFGLQSVEFSPIEPYLLTWNLSFFADLWNVTRAEKIATFAFVEHSDVPGEPYFGNATLSPDGMTIIGTDGNDLYFYSGITGALQTSTSKTGMTEEERIYFSLCGFAYDPTGHWIISGGDKLRIWDATFNSVTVLRDELSVRDRPGSCEVGFRADSAQMAYGDRTNTGLWDFESRAYIAMVKGRFATFTPMNQLITYDSSNAYVWNSQGEPVATLEG